MFEHHPLWRIGFRPFFMLASAFAILIIAYWLLALGGQLPHSVSPLWHAHEMLYGFGSAVLVGFLLTALQNWSQQRGIHGRPLQRLVLLWGVARILAFFPEPFWSGLYACADLSFWLYLLWLVHPYLQKTSRNKVFYLILGLFTLGNACFHLYGPWARTGVYLALYLYLLLCMLIGGRIIPLFTRNAISGANPVSWPVLEKAVLISSVLWVVSELGFAQSAAAQFFAWGAALMHTLRWLAWKPWLTWNKPLLWSLFVAYLWLPVALFCRGFWGQASWITHLFTLGVMGMMMYAMMTRVALGHTGRPIQASLAITLGYLVFQLAVFTRTFATLWWPTHFQNLMYVTGGLWSLAFVLYAMYYWPILGATRPDGRTDS